MAAGGTSSNVDLGPGRLYYAPVGTTEPTTCSAALPSAWQVVGYTEDGSEFTFETTTEAVEVAEELDPVRYVGTTRTTRLVVNLAEPTAKRLTLAVGAGAAGTDTSTAIEPPDPEDVVDVMLVWDKMDTTDATNRRYLFRQARPSGAVTISNRKAPTKRLIALTMDCSKPTGLAPWKVFPNSSGQV